MSLTIGIYDLFAYIIPGLLYLFVINEFLQVMGAASLALGDFLSLPAGVGLVALALAAVAAHLLGHLLDPLAKRIVDLVTARTKPSEAALTGLKARYPSLDIRFAAKDWSMLFTLLRLRNQESSRIADTFQANCIMFRNIFLGLMASFAVQIAGLITNYSRLGLILLMFTALLSVLAARRSRMFNLWFFTNIFEASLHYGNSLQDVLSYPLRRQRSLSRLELVHEGPEPKSKIIGLFDGSKRKRVDAEVLANLLEADLPERSRNAATISVMVVRSAAPVRTFLRTAVGPHCPTP